MMPEEEAEKRINPKPCVEDPGFPCLNRLFGGLLLLLSFLATACSPQPADVPTLPPDATTEVIRSRVLCPTENEQARQFYNDAVELEMLGNLEEAEGLYLNAIELDPGFCDAMDNLGLVLRHQGNVQEAIYWYKRSIEILPDSLWAHQNLAVAYSLVGRTDEAITEWRLLISLDPENPEGYYGLGTVYLDLGQYREAVTQFKKAEERYIAQSSPLVTDTHMGLAVAYYAVGECEQAKEYLEPLCSDAHHKADANYVLGLCYLCPEMEDLELADAYLTKAQALGVEIPEEVLQRLGR